MSVKKLDDFSPLPGILPAGRMVLSGVRSETTYAKALREEFAYLVHEPKERAAPQKSQSLELRAERT